ncbi:MAG: thermonuclease family protein [Nitrosopumilus sp.]
MKLAITAIIVLLLFVAIFVVPFVDKFQTFNCITTPCEMPKITIAQKIWQSYTESVEQIKKIPDTLPEGAMDDVIDTMPEIKIPEISLTSPTQGPTCSGTARCVTGTVTRIIDGDTLKVDNQPIRFALSSAPELDEFDGGEARNLIDNRCPPGSLATVDEDDGQPGGSYGRIIAVVYCNGYNLNSELLDANLGYIPPGFCVNSEFADEPWAIKHGC